MTSLILIDGALLAVIAFNLWPRDRKDRGLLGPVAMLVCVMCLFRLVLAFAWRELELPGGLEHWGWRFGLYGMVFLVSLIVSVLWVVFRLANKSKRRKRVARNAHRSGEAR